jgi:signal transduction histidine kinase
VIALFDPASGTRAAVFAIWTNLLWLGLVVWGVTSEVHPGLHGEHLATVILLAVAGIGWLLWLATRVWGPAWLRLPSFILMATAGGALGAFAGLGLVFVGVAGLAAGMTWSTHRAVMVTAAGPVATLVAASAAGNGLVNAAWAITAALGGLTLGIARRQTQEHAAQTARVQVVEAQADAERARAELLAGRNHMARELHDILAHTLSALSLQLEALSALIDAGAEPTPAVRSQLDGIRRLVREGLDDARGAVQALREDLPPLEDQLAKLAGDRHADLRVDGVPRQLSPDVSLALYRVAQEALTNVAKHAPGAATAVDLSFADGLVRLSVSNDFGAQPTNGSTKLAASGGGYGLQGIRERVLLLGGHVDAGPAAEGWRVEAEVPA